MNIDEDFTITEEDEEVLRELRKGGAGVEEDVRVDPVTGRKEKKKALLNKRKLSSHEMDEFFMDF